ncbi:MAG TPA: hypothetical protein VGF67_17480 [Ktedonobacteraceae bacterium]|jgi:hypothetical protein
MIHDENDEASPHIPPDTFHLMAHPFRPTREYQAIAGFSETVRALEEQGRLRSAMEEILTVLESHPGHPQALMLAMILLGESRTNRRRAREPLPQAVLLDTRLDAIYAVCSHCREKEWVPEAIAMIPYAKMLVNDPVGLQCYQCGYVLCRACLQSFPASAGISLASSTCPNCLRGKLRSPVFPTGRRPHQLSRHTDSVVRVLLLREGPVPPDNAYIQHLLEMVSPDILGKRGTIINAFPVSSWSEDIDHLADAMVTRMEMDGTLPPGSFDRVERAHVQDRDGIRCLIVKMMQQGQQHDLARLGLPREGRSFEETLQDQKQELARQTGGTVSLALDCQDMAVGQGVNSPVVRSLNGRAFVVLRLDALPAGELQQLQEAVEQNRVLLVPVLARCPTYPVLVLKFVLYDDPTNPYSVQGPRGIHDATVQEFLQAVLHNGGGDLYLYAGPDAHPCGSGTFALRMPPFSGPGYPYRTQPADLERFWLLLVRAAHDLEQLPQAVRDFPQAARFYLAHTS